MQRRTIIQSAGIGLLNVAWLHLPASAADNTPNYYQITSALGQQRLDAELSNETELWQYNGACPGTLIRTKQGETVTIDYHNQLAEGSAIHWHGLRIDNAMDGVVGMTQSSVKPDAHFQYQFIPPDAGTYWYHAHQRSYEQVGRGLYGILIVDESTSIDVDQDIVLAFDDWRLDQQGQIVEPFNNLHDISHQGRTGNWLTVNGKGAESVTLKRGERARLRLINTANALVMTLALPKWPHWLMALDGMPITPTKNLDQIILAPGQRADFFIDTPIHLSTEHIALRVRNGAIPLVKFNFDAIDSRPQRTSPPTSLPDNLPLTDPNEWARRISLKLEGGAMGRMQQATMHGQLVGIRELIKRDKAWALNGVVNLPTTPLLEIKQGEIIEIEMQNQTAWPHVMHLHGHHFEVLENFSSWINDGNDHPPKIVLRDAILIERNQTITIRFRADNLGKWLIHCHMLEHQAGGMVTWVNVI